MRKAILRRLVAVLAAATLGTSFAAVPATPASAEIWRDIARLIEGDRVERHAWMNYNTDGGWLRAYAMVFPLDPLYVTISWVCIQNELGSERCTPDNGQNPAGAAALESPQTQCVPGLKYRSIAHWQAFNTGVYHSGVAKSDGWWRCPPRS